MIISLHHPAITSPAVINCNPITLVATLQIMGS